MAVQYRDHIVPSSTRRVLLVDDDVDLAESQAELLQTHGFDVRVAHSSADGLAAAREFDADVALIDVRLGRGDGVQLMTELLRERSDLVCVIVTGYASVDTAISALQKGAYDYLRKPVHPDELAATLDRCFERILLQRNRAASLDLLRESEKRFRSVVNNAGDGIFVLDADGWIIDAGDSACRILRYTREELLGLNFADLERSTGYEELKRRWDRIPDRPVTFEGTFHPRSGAPFPVEFRVARFGGVNERQLIAVVRDVTERKRAEEALRASEKYNRTLFDSSPVGLVLSRPDGAIVDANGEFARIVGHKVEDILGYNLNDLTQETHRDELRHQMQLLAETGACGPYETELRHSDGSSVSARVSALGLEREGEQFVWSSVEDITSQKATEEQLRQAQKMEAVGQLTGGVAHDFNNLLAIVMGNLELAQEHLDENGKVSEFVGRALAAAERGAMLTQRLLAFSRKQALQPRIIDINLLVSGMMELVRRTLGETIEIEVVNDSDLWRCRADPAQLESALLNLAVNARDAMPGGGKLMIGMSNVHFRDDDPGMPLELAPGDYVHLLVADTGAGMSRDVLDRVFEPFFTTKDVGTGSGLGLSMVFGFVKQSGGHVSIYSEPGQGTAVSLYLPSYLDDGDPERRRVSGELPRAGGEAVLVVEDDEQVRAIVVRMLADLGYRVVMAEDAASALEVLRSGTAVDLLLSDVVLPGGVGGPALVAEVRREFPGLRVLYMSGYPRAADHDTFGGGERLLHKPFTKVEFAHAVRSALG